MGRHRRRSRVPLSSTDGVGVLGCCICGSPCGIGIIVICGRSRQASYCYSLSSQLQPGAAEPQAFFTRVGPGVRETATHARLLQLDLHLAGSVDLAICPALGCYRILAFWRVRPKTARLFLIGMPAIGILSVPLSYILLDQLKWGLIPQFQPARALLFVTAFAVILGAAAAIRAAEQSAGSNPCFGL